MPTIMSLPDTWINLSQAARRLGTYPMQVRRMVLRGELPAVKTNLGFLVDADAVERLRVEQEQAKED